MNHMYLIVVDLINTTHDYAHLYNAIKQFGAWWHYLNNSWIVRTQQQLDLMVETLRAHIAQGDHFMIVDISNMPRNGWMPRDAWEWLRNHEADTNTGTSQTTTTNE